MSLLVVCQDHSGFLNFHVHVGIRRLHWNSSCNWNLVKGEKSLKSSYYCVNLETSGIASCMFTLNVFGATLNPVICYLFSNLYELLPTHGLDIHNSVSTGGQCQSLEQQQRQPRIRNHLPLPKKIYGANKPKCGWKPRFSVSLLGAFNANSCGTSNTSAALLMVFGRSVTLWALAGEHRNPRASDLMARTVGNFRPWWNWSNINKQHLPCFAFLPSGI